MGQECVYIIGKSDISTLVDSVLAVILLRENLICSEGCNGLQFFYSVLLVGEINKFEVAHASTAQSS